MTKPEINGNVIIVKPIYVTATRSETQNNQDELELDVTLYDTETLQTFKTINKYH